MASAPSVPSAPPLQSEEAGAGSQQPDNKESGESEKNDSTFECAICLDFVKEPVVSLCGHLFCWPCLHTWLETRPNRQFCPVCKAAISRDKVVPLYSGRGGNQEDPR